MKYVSLFSGIEAATVAWESLGWEPVAFSEIDPFCCELLAKRFPDVPNLRDVSEVDWSEYAGTVDLIVGGSPCFVAGTPVTTARGVIPIENVRPGDLVLTHKGRWRKVLNTGSSIGDTVVLKGQGTAEIECTPGHPFLAREKWKKSTKRDGKSLYLKGVTDTEWVRASDMNHKFWFCPSEIEELPIPKLAQSSFTYQGTGEGHLKDFEFSSGFFYFVGMWLGDGWANEHRRKERRDSVMKRVYICCAKGEETQMALTLESTGLHWGMAETRTTYRFTCSSNQLYDWIVRNFGIHADGKTLPGWVFSMKREWREALYRGYLATDGYKNGKDIRSVSISRNLTVGMKTLAGTLGYSTSVTRTEPQEKQTIEGRVVSTRPYYTQTYYQSSRSAFFKDGGWWGLVRSVEGGSREATVYNLEVEEDNSYVADGIAAHNCQAFSIAGNRRGLMDERGRLMLEYVRAVREVHPRWLLWENVPGVLSQSNGDAFDTLQRELEKCGYSLAWRTLDAQFYGVAQRRRRVFLVGHARAGCAAAVLFERESLRWDCPSSADKRKALAEDANGCIGRSYTVVTRCGKPGGGKGALVSEDVSLTLSTLNEQTVFAPAYSIQLGQTSANGSNISEETAPTLDCSGPCAVSLRSSDQEEKCLGFCGGASPMSGSIGACVELSPTMKAGGNLASVPSVVYPIKPHQTVCLADDNANAAVDEELAGTLKVGGGQPIVAYEDGQ